MLGYVVAQNGATRGLWAKEGTLSGRAPYEPGKLVSGAHSVSGRHDELGALVASAGTKESAASRFAYSNSLKSRSSGVIILCSRFTVWLALILHPECREVATIDKNSSRLCTC